MIRVAAIGVLVRGTGDQYDTLYDATEMLLRGRRLGASGGSLLRLVSHEVLHLAWERGTDLRSSRDLALEALFAIRSARAHARSGRARHFVVRSMLDSAGGTRRSRASRSGKFI